MPADRTESSKDITTFKPGKSGNPKGRPKGSKNIATLVKAAVMAECEDILLRDVPRILKQMVKQAMGYDEKYTEANSDGKMVTKTRAIPPDPVMQRYLVDKFMPPASAAPGAAGGSGVQINITVEQKEDSPSRPTIEVVPE